MHAPWLVSIVLTLNCIYSRSSLSSSSKALVFNQSTHFRSLCSCLWFIHLFRCYRYTIFILTIGIRAGDCVNHTQLFCRRVVRVIPLLLDMFQSSSLFWLIVDIGSWSVLRPKLVSNLHIWFFTCFKWIDSMQPEDLYTLSFNLSSNIGSTTRILILFHQDYEVWALHFEDYVQGLEDNGSLIWEAMTV